MAKRFELKDFNKILDELNGASDRASILVATALVEDGIYFMLKDQLRPIENSDDESSVFGDRGIFGSFNNMIVGAYFLKLIGPQTRRDLDLMRRIRNLAAHDPNPALFSEPEIASRCREIELIAYPGSTTPQLQTLKQKFIACAQIYSGMFLARTYLESSGKGEGVVTLLEK